MSIRRVNHVVLSVTDLDASTAFYTDVLGLITVATMPGNPHWPAMVFLRSPFASTNHHDLGLIANADGRVDVGVPAGLFHVAFEVGTLDELEQLQTRLQAIGAYQSSTNQGMHLSVYCMDPDGLAIEIIWRAPDEDWSYQDQLSRSALDFTAARQRWGARTTGAAAGVPA